MGSSLHCFARAGAFLMAATFAAASYGQEKKSESQGGAAAAQSEFLTGMLEADNLYGKWCGNLGDYFFTPKKINVKRHEDGKKWSYEIEKLNFGEGWIEVLFKVPGREGAKNNTVYYEFAKDGQSMAQKANESGDMGPKMRFRRCK